MQHSIIMLAAKMRCKKFQVSIMFVYNLVCNCNYKYSLLIVRRNFIVINNPLSFGALILIDRSLVHNFEWSLYAFKILTLTKFCSTRHGDALFYLQNT